MFIGEMGCFLVVFLSYLHTRFVLPRTSSAPLFAGGYQTINSDEPTPAEYADEEDEAEGQDIENQTNPVKALDTDGPHTKLHGWRILLLAAPACCDILGTTMMNAGLLFVAASIYQMTRGALVLFVGLFSVLFLRRKLYLYKWFGLVVVVLGVAIVGLSGALFGHDELEPEDAIGVTAAAARTPEAVRVTIGVLLIAAAQIFTASQFVVEEWVLENYSMAPLKVVGWEGVFGLLVTLIGMVVLHLTVGATEAGEQGYFDLREGWRQVTSNRAITVSSLMIMISIG
jgi:Nucleotide-sugar transporter